MDQTGDSGISIALLFRVNLSNPVLAPQGSRRGFDELTVNGGEGSRPTFPAIVLGEPVESPAMSSCGGPPLRRVRVKVDETARQAHRERLLEQDIRESRGRVQGGVSAGS